MQFTKIKLDSFNYKSKNRIYTNIRTAHIRNLKMNQLLKSRTIDLLNS